MHDEAQADEQLICNLEMYILKKFMMINHATLEETQEALKKEQLHLLTALAKEMK